MKYIKLVLIILLNSANSAQAMAKQAIMFFLKDQDTNQVIYDMPLQVTYGGYFTSSNSNGQIILPRKTENLDFYILITENIVPVFSFKNNVSHFKLKANQSSKLYHITTMPSANNDQLQWQTELVDIADHDHIPLHSIIVLADPTKFTMLTGLSELKNNSHLILPSLYFNSSSLDPVNILELPNQRPFLAQLKTVYQLTPYGYATVQTR